ncbi:MAG: hypothetical protein V1862_11705 [Methanobacteriota archaeon]
MSGDTWHVSGILQVRAKKNGTRAEIEGKLAKALDDICLYASLQHPEYEFERPAVSLWQRLSDRLRS